MRRKKHRMGRAKACVLVVGVMLGVAGTIACQQADRAFAWWESLRGMVGSRSAIESSPQPSALDQARGVQRRLRERLAELELQRRELEGRIRLLEIRSPPEIERGQSEDDQQKRRSQCDAYARQLVEIQAQFKAGQTMLQRVDRLVQEHEIGATIEQADRDLLLEAAELLWTEDPGRTGPNAVIPAGDWGET